MKSRTRGLSIIEVLVSIGVVSILLSIALPALSGAMSKGRAVAADARCRQIGQALFHYASDFNDLPPILGPVDSSGISTWTMDFGTSRRPWFNHANRYSLVLASYVGTWRDMIAPGNPEIYPHEKHGGVEVARSDYYLTNTMYASPSFFNWNTLVGPSQFAGQHLGSVAFPSAKGMLWQNLLFHVPGVGTAVACCLADVATPIAFCDGSVSEMVMRRMPPGIINPFAGALIPPDMDPREIHGSPVSDTIDGIMGRDR